MNVYWLSRDGVSPAEGPFAIGHLKRIYEAGEVTTRAQVCLEGTDAWAPLHQELEHEEEMNRQLLPKPMQPRREKSFEQVLYERDERSVKNWGNVAGVLMIVTVLAAMVPVLGLLIWFVFGFVSLICTILAVMMMTKGAVGRGILTICLAWFGLPLMMLVGQIFVHAFFAAATKA